MNKKGFTLVELLAVIVILAVIALITLPLVLNLIEDSRKGAAESSMLQYVDAIEKVIVTNSMNATVHSEYDGEYTVKGKKIYKEDNSIVLNLEMILKGDEPVNPNKADDWGNNVTLKNGNVVLAKAKFGRYFVTYYIKEDKNTIYCSSKEKYPTECK